MKSLGKIREELISSLFSVSSVDGKFIKLHNLQDTKFYKLFKEKIEGINIKDVLLINYFIRDVKNEEIVFTQLSLIKQLNQSSFFYLVKRYASDNSRVFKIVDEEMNYYIMIDDKKSYLN